MWKDLSIQQKSEVMKMAISQGLTDLNEIKKMYDASIPNIEASSVNNTYSSVPYNPSPKDVRYDDGGHLYPAGGILTIGATSWPQVVINTVRNRLYDNLVPFGYHHPTERVYNSVIANKKELLEDGVMDDDTKETLDALWGTYLNIPNSNRHSVHSNNAIERSQGPDPNKVYYRLNNLDPIIDTVVDEGIGYEMPIRKDPRAPYVYYPHEGLKVGESKIVPAGNQVLGDFTVGRGRDDRGEYLSYSDTWDINPWQKTANQYGQNNEGSEPFLSKVARSLVPKQGDASFGIGTPVNIYDKIYLDDLYGLSSDAVRGTMYLPEVTIWGKANPRKRKINLSSPSDTFAYGGPLGNIYKGRGNKSQQIYVSSPFIRKRISNWEGKSMHKPAPDTGKVNNPFEKEDAAFWSTIPINIRPYLTQDMLDALYSTSYNIGSGNFKKRVVPELKKFFIDGTGSIEAIKNSMYGTRDKEAGMSGLRTRRAAERQMFEDAFNAKYPKGFTLDKVPYKATKVNSNVKWDGKKSIQENLESLGVKFIPTSGYRSPKQQSKFKTPASKSWHTHLDEYGNSRAIDIVPAKGMTFDDLRAQLMSPEVQAAFTTYGLGVLDETNTATKKKTGATGDHFHIGPDKSARAGYAAWINSKMPNSPQINIESPVFYTAANDLQWQPSIVASSRQEDIAPLLVQDNKPLIVEPLEDTSSTPKDFSAIWDQIFPKVENTQEEFNPLLDPSTQFTALQSRPRYQMKPTPIINMPTSNGDNDYMLFKPLAKGGNLFDTGSYLRNYQWMTMPQTDTVYTDYETGLPIQAGQKVWADAQGNLVTVETPNALEDYAAQYKPNASFYGPVLDQVNVTGTVNPNKPMSAQPDAFAERYAQLLAAPIASNADVDKVFEEQGQWQWEQSKEKHDADVKAADLEIQKLHPIDDILPKIPEYIAAPFRYTGQYLFNAFDSDFIDLSNKRVSEINSDTKNIESILFNDFIENNSNSFRSAKNYKVTNDTLIGDKHIPLSQINTFWGVENGKLKVAPIEAFDDNTIVAPNRAKGSKEHLKEVVINPEWKGYDRKKNKENATKAREYAEEEAKRIGIKPSIMSKIFRPYRSLIQGYPALMDVREALSNDAYLKLIDRATDMYPTSPPPSVYLGVTENNDTIPIQIVGPKMFLGNESGNAAFISQPIEHMQEINNFLRNNPSYIGLPDNGRYSGYQLSNPSYIGYRGPTTAPMFVVGTIK